MFAVPGSSNTRSLVTSNGFDRHAGAFTPGCSAKHLPPYIENLKAIKDKGVDVVAVVAFNDAWVMSAWGKANGVKGDDIVGNSTRQHCQPLRWPTQDQSGSCVSASGRHMC